MSSTDAAVPVTAAKSAGHPRGLYVLFGAEMWERFSYYGMRALLTLYLTHRLNFAEEDALEVYGTYTGLVYLTPLLGGYLADRYLGQRKAILVGGLLMALGQFALTVESLLSLGLGLLILGNGFFKPNISTMVGQLYDTHDPRRDSAYTIFYMGINLGAFFSPLVCGTLGEKVGWSFGFAAAGVGMVLGLLSFGYFQHTLGRIGFAPGRDPGPGAHRLQAVDWLHVAALVAIGVGLVVVAVMPAGAILDALPESLGKPGLLVYWLALAAALAGITHVVTRVGGGTPVDASLEDARPIDAARRGDAAGMVEPGRELAGSPADGSENPWSAPTAELGQAEEPGVAAPEEADEGPFTSAQWQRIAVILVVAAFSIVFWMGFEQAGGTLTLFADNRTDRNILGFEFPASWYQSVNPLGIILLAPVFSILWTALDRTRFRLNSAAKMGVGLLLLGLGMVVMMQADRVADSQPPYETKAGPQWLVGVYLLFTVGELCLSPIGLSLVNKLAPARIASLMMAIWFLCTALANYLAANMEEYVGKDWLWPFLAAAAFAPGLILLALNPVLRRMSHGRL